MDLSTKHENAVIAACRLPALYARLALLASAVAPNAYMEYYGTVRPAPGADPGGSPLATLALSATAGTVTEELFQIQIDVPLETQITGADPATGTDVVWARIYDGEGDWWADVSVTDEDGDGEVKVVNIRFYNGEFARLTSFVIQG